MQTLTGLCSCAVPQQLLPRLLSAGQFKCPHCRTTQGLPEGLGTQQEARLLFADSQRVPQWPSQSQTYRALVPEMGIVFVLLTTYSAFFRVQFLMIASCWLDKERSAMSG